MSDTQTNTSPKSTTSGSRVSVQKGRLDGVLVLRPPTVFRDARGEYIETYNEQLYRKAGVHVKFIQDDVSVSNRHVLRGLHGDQTTWKLISCLQGEFFLALVNWDPKSPQYGQWDSFTMSAADPKQVLVPPKFGNGHLVLSDRAIFHYKQSTYYDRAAQFTIRWNDPKLRIPWPVKDPFLSKRDAEAPDA